MASGFNQTVVKQGDCEVCRIEILPFLKQNANQPHTIYACLAYPQTLIETNKPGTSPVIFDQPLHIKAVEIVQASAEITTLFVRLGRFHFIMSCMGAIGINISKSGLQVQWETVYALHSVQHMLTDHPHAWIVRHT